MECERPGTSSKGQDHQEEETISDVRSPINDHSDKVCSSESVIDRLILSNDGNTGVKKKKGSVERFSAETDCNKYTLTYSDFGNLQHEVFGKKLFMKWNFGPHFLSQSSEKFECEDCGKIFSKRSHLKTHLITHTGERNFDCEECGKSFTQKGSLKAHFLTHTGERNFKCEECGKTFTLKHNLKTHLSTHTGEKNFECEECGKIFTRKSHLDTHILTIHLGEKNFECQLCGKKFPQKGTLNRHILTHTKKRKYVRKKK